MARRLPLLHAKEGTIVIEVPAQLDAHRVRGIALTPTQGLARGRNAIDRQAAPTDVPEVMGGGTATLRALIREYLFVSLFRACAESLASENASRLAAMQRADKNIEGLPKDLNGTFHRVRQSGIDEELFDVVAGFEAVSEEKAHRGTE